MNNPIELNPIKVSGHLRIQNNIYQMVFSWKGGNNQRLTRQVSTNLSVSRKYTTKDKLNPI